MTVGGSFYPPSRPHSTAWTSTDLALLISLGLDARPRRIVVVEVLEPPVDLFLTREWADGVCKCAACRTALASAMDVLHAAVAQAEAADAEADADDDNEADAPVDVEADVPEPPPSLRPGPVYPSVVAPPSGRVLMCQRGVSCTTHRDGNELVRPRHAGAAHPAEVTGARGDRGDAAPARAPLRLPAHAPAAGRRHRDRRGSSLNAHPPLRQPFPLTLVVVSGVLRPAR